MDELSIRPFRPQDAGAVSALVRRSLLEVNIRDYDPAQVAAWAAYYTPEEIARVAGAGRLYVAWRGSRAVGSGAVAPGPEGGCVLRTVFVLPEEQGQGVGRRIVETLERDPAFLAADPIALDASKTSRGFYEALGYVHTGGAPHLVDDDHYPMEKRR
jgi:GNAT superfamily N-acetyltransferase